MSDNGGEEDRGIGLGGTRAGVGRAEGTRASFRIPPTGRDRPPSGRKGGGSSPGGPPGRPPRPGFFTSLGRFWLELGGLLLLYSFFKSFYATFAIVIFTVLGISVVGLVVGLIRPRWVLPARMAPTRLAVLGVYFTLLMVVLVIFGIIGMVVDPEADPSDPSGTRIERGTADD